MQWMIRLVAVLLLLTISAPGGVAYAQVPQTLNYQGYLTDSAGQALLDSEVVEFSIYAAETGGAPLWSEFQSVFPAQGLFSTTLGNTANPFPPGMFNTPLYLGVKVGTDNEMTPRAALSSAAFSLKALDSETLEGMTSSDLDQSSDVATLSSDLTNGLSSLQAQITQVGSDLASAETTITQVETNVTTVTLDVAQVENDVSVIEGDITSIESTLTDKQNRVFQSCVAGASIRQIALNGSVTCEVDDSGPWLTNSSSYPYMVFGGRVGIGTSAPAAALQIDAPIDVDPFRARVQSSTKLRVHTNGSVSVGTSSAGPENGLYVLGSVGFGTAAPLARVTTTDSNWQFQLDNNDLGGDDWFMGASSNSWAAGGGKFVLSNTNNSGAAAVVVDATNNVGIGNLSPSTRLHVSGGSDVNPVSGGFVTIGNDTSSHLAFDNNEIMSRNNGSVAVLALNAEGGQVTINSGGTRDANALKVVGRVDFDNGGNSGMRITATTSSPTSALFEPTQFEEGLVGGSVRPFWRMYSREFYAQSALQYRTYSDRSLKSNIAPIQSAIDTIKALEGVSYELTTSPMGKRERALTAEEQFVNDNQLGFIAQDVAKVLPQLVTEDESTGLRTVAYMGVIPVLVEALKEQQKQLEAQRAELDELKARLK